MFWSSLVILFYTTARDLALARPLLFFCNFKGNWLATISIYRATILMSRYPFGSLVDDPDHFFFHPKTVARFCFNFPDLTILRNNKTNDHLVYAHRCFLLHRNICI